ncbi:MAG: hypothetical protein QXW94_04795 [Desulfurococcaceae archaeon]
MCRYYAFRDPDALYRRTVRLLAFAVAPAFVVLLYAALRGLGLQAPALPLQLAGSAALAPLLLLVPALRPYAGYKAHLKRLGEESYWAVLVASVYAQAGLSAAQIFNRLKEKEAALPHASFELRRIARDSAVALQPLPAILSREADRPVGGVWRQLLSTLSFLERGGGPPAQAFRDLHSHAVSHLKASFRSMSGRMNAVSTAVASLFTVVPVTLYAIFILLASPHLPAMVAAYSIFSALAAAGVMLLADGLSPDVYPRWFAPIYLKPALRWLPLGLALGASVSMGLLTTPLALRFPHVIAVTLGSCGFALPAYLEWRRHDSAITEAVEGLPALLRDLAEEVRRGSSPFRALELLTARGRRGFDRLLKLVACKARLSGLDGALRGFAHLLPKPTLLALELVKDLEELGAGAEALDGLAEAFRESVDSMAEYRSSVSLNRWMIAVGVALAGLVAAALLGVVVPMLADMTVNAGGALPFNLPIGAWDRCSTVNLVFLGLSASAVTSGLLGGKLSTFRLGEGLRDAAVCCLVLLASLLVGVLAGWV